MFQRPYLGHAIRCTSRCDVLPDSDDKSPKVLLKIREELTLSTQPLSKAFGTHHGPFAFTVRRVLKFPLTIKPLTMPVKKKLQRRSPTQISGEINHLAPGGLL
jgi:hypothetical protein